MFISLYIKLVAEIDKRLDEENANPEPEPTEEEDPASDSQNDESYPSAKDWSRAVLLFSIKVKLNRLSISALTDWGSYSLSSALL